MGKRKKKRKYPGRSVLKKNEGRLKKKKVSDLFTGNVRYVGFGEDGELNPRASLVETYQKIRKILSGLSNAEKEQLVQEYAVETELYLEERRGKASLSVTPSVSICGLQYALDRIKENKEHYTMISDNNINPLVENPAFKSTKPTLHQPDIAREPIGSTKPTIKPPPFPSTKPKVKISNIKGEYAPAKVSRVVQTTVRKQELVAHLKSIYEDTCQVCQERIEVSHDVYLSEVHHIQPLGEHAGPDVLENMIVLCPNHHSLMDRGAITIDLNKNIVLHCNRGNGLNGKSIILKHEIDQTYIDYHNKHIYVGNV